MFEKGLKEQKDPIITARSAFWKAESEYNLENYQRSFIKL